MAAKQQKTTSRRKNAGKEKNFIGKYTKENTGSDTGRKDSAGRHPG